MNKGPNDNRSRNDTYVPNKNLYSNRSYDNFGSDKRDAGNSVPNQGYKGQGKYDKQIKQGQNGSYDKRNKAKSGYQYNKFNRANQQPSSSDSEQKQWKNDTRTLKNDQTSQPDNKIENTSINPEFPSSTAVKDTADNVNYRTQPQQSEYLKTNQKLQKRQRSHEQFYNSGVNQQPRIANHPPGFTYQNNPYAPYVNYEISENPITSFESVLDHQPAPQPVVEPEQAPKTTTKCVLRLPVDLKGIEMNLEIFGSFAAPTAPSEPTVSVEETLPDEPIYSPPPSPAKVTKEAELEPPRKSERQRRQNFSAYTPGAKQTEQRPQPAFSTAEYRPGVTQEVQKSEEKPKRNTPAFRPRRESDIEREAEEAVKKDAEEKPIPNGESQVEEETPKAKEVEKERETPKEVMKRKMQPYIPKKESSPAPTSTEEVPQKESVEMAPKKEEIPLQQPKAPQGPFAPMQMFPMPMMAMAMGMPIPPMPQMNQMPPINQMPQKPQPQGGMPHVLQMPQMQGGMPQMQGGMPQMQGGMPQMQGGMPQMQGGMPQMQGGMPQMQGGMPQLMQMPQMPVFKAQPKADKTVENGNGNMTVKLTQNEFDQFKMFQDFIKNQAMGAPMPMGVQLPAGSQVMTMNNQGHPAPQGPALRK